MNPLSTSTPQTFGQLLALAFKIYPIHSGILLRTAAIFYLPVAVLAFFFAKDAVTSTLFLTMIFPIQALVNLSLISLCVELLHGRPLAVRPAVRRGLRRLLANIGMMIVVSVVYAGAFTILAIPLWVGLVNTDIPLTEFRYTFSPPVRPGDIEAIMKVLDNILWGVGGICLSGVLILLVLFYLSVRWGIAQAALMAEGTGPLESLARSWNLSREFVLRTAGYLLLLSIPLGLVGGLFGAFMQFAVFPMFPALDESSKVGFSGAFSILLSIITTPFHVTAITLYYFDLRVRKERITIQPQSNPDPE